MYKKICPICNRNFEVANSRYKYCSDECRKQQKRQNDRVHAKLYYHSSRGMHNYKAYYKPVEKYCPDCGKRLDDGRQTWCVDCLLKDYAETKSRIAYKRLSCRGYDRELITEEINSRGITKCAY